MMVTKGCRANPGNFSFSKSHLLVREVLAATNRYTTVIGKQKSVIYCQNWSGREDLNLRPHGAEKGSLPVRGKRRSPDCIFTLLMPFPLHFKASPVIWEAP